MGGLTTDNVAGTGKAPSGRRLPKETTRSLDPFPMALRYCASMWTSRSLRPATSDIRSPVSSMMVTSAVFRAPRAVLGLMVSQDPVDLLPVEGFDDQVGRSWAV